MAPKGAEEPKSTEEPPAKKTKVEEEKKEDKFVEPDAPKDSRAKLKEKIGFEASDMTLNVVPTLGGSTLMALTDGGMSYLLAGARCTVGQKAGRYMFEVKVVQTMTPAVYGGAQRPKQVLRVGFSTSTSSLLLGDDADSIAFDGDGFFVAERRRQHATSQPFGKSHVVGVVLNLDAKSPNVNTVTLFRDGQPISEPVLLPEHLKGKALHPHVCFRNVSVYLNFGPTPLRDLPFKCRTLQDAAASDVVVTPTSIPKDGKYEVVVPVGKPDEGTFDWLDMYLEKNSKYVELSDRKIVEWAKSSGIWAKNAKGAGKSSNDKPNMHFGVPAMEGLNLHRMINTVASIMPRNYVVMEVQSNLIAKERVESLKRFNMPHYKKVAHVVMGEPTKDFKELVHKKILKGKQDKADQLWKETQRRKELAKKQKELVKQREAVEADKNKKAEEEEKKAEDAGEEKPADGGEKAAEDTPAEAETTEEKAEGEAEEESEPPKAELTDEEKLLSFTPKQQPDLTPQAMNAHFAKFSTPEKDEGFDDIRYEWEAGDKAKEYLKSWVTTTKLNTKIEDLRPGQFFKDKVKEFIKFVKECKDKQKAHTPKPAKKEEEKKEGEEEEEEIDVWKVENIMDIGEGVPLFEKFVAEDWAMLQTRFELWVLVTAFIKDSGDPDRTGSPQDHVPFYYQKYFHKALNPANFGVKDIEEYLALSKDTVGIKDSVLVSVLEKEPESPEVFLKLTEQTRRERQRRIDIGDESARLKFSATQAGFVDLDKALQLAEHSARVVQPRDATHGKGYTRDYGKGKSYGKGKVYK